MHGSTVYQRGHAQSFVRATTFYLPAKRVSMEYPGENIKAITSSPKKGMKYVVIRQSVGRRRRNILRGRFVVPVTLD